MALPTLRLAARIPSHLPSRASTDNRARLPHLLRRLECRNRSHPADTLRAHIPPRMPNGVVRRAQRRVGQLVSQLPIRVLPLARRRPRAAW